MGSGAGLAACATAPAAPTPALSAFRDAFAYGERRTPMNAANYCPMPKTVADALHTEQRRIDADPSPPNRARYREAAEAARAALGALMGAPPDTIALVRNATEANNTLVRGLALDPGDEVVLWDENHESLNVAWDVRAARDRFTARRVAWPAGEVDEGAILAAFADAMGPRTRALAFSQVSNITGRRLPAAALCALARERGAVSIVDGAQTVGVDALDLQAMGCDAFTASAHKWLMGPPETGVLFVRADIIHALAPLNVSLHWGEEPVTAQIGARKFESFGQRNDAAFPALLAATQLHRAFGPAAIEARAGALAGRLTAGLEALELAPVAPMSGPLSSPVIVLPADTTIRANVVADIFETEGVALATKGGVRISPHVYNTEDQIDRVLAGLERHRAMLRLA
ncbi:MAG: aminotransferase class V-fold PLP-dependent enzyme [Caulobacterales bacterium]|nr:aminotransferase class V-fold PLP-dependent enzyme [Caulobacterales bacterium]